MCIEHPTGKLHPFERQFTESWTTRWFRMTGIRPQIKEGKRATTAASSRVSAKLRTKRAATPMPQNLPHKTNGQSRPRAMIPDRLEQFDGLEI